MCNLVFILKAIERVVSSCSHNYMNKNRLRDPTQSAYRSGNSTETGPLRVYSDIVSAIDKEHGVFLIL